MNDSPENILITRSDEVQDSTIPVEPFPDEPPPLVEFSEITKYFGSNRVLDSIDMTINHGEFLTLLGPSGCGKTTMLRILAGFEKPTSGQIFMNGTDITRLDSNRRHVNTVFQSYALFPHMTVFDNVAFGLRMKKVPEAIVHEEVSQALETVRMYTYATRKPHELSGGQQQRVAMARAFVNKPKILLLDEPLSALDHKLRQEMQLELKALHKKLGISFLFVTHDQEEAFSMSDRVVVMNEGYVEQIGTPTDIYENPTNMFVAKFVGEINVFEGIVTALFEDTFKVQIEGLNYTLKLPKNVKREKFTPRSRIKILLRPEDLLLNRATDPNDMKVVRNTTLRGKIYDIVYKGMIVNILINMPNGQKVTATQFFNEDDPNINYSIGDYVNIRFIKDWEVILTDEE